MSCGGLLEAWLVWLLLLVLLLMEEVLVVHTEYGESLEGMLLPGGFSLFTPAVPAITRGNKLICFHVSFQNDEINSSMLMIYQPFQYHRFFAVAGPTKGLQLS